jgi:microcystin-dependent protein
MSQPFVGEIRFVGFNFAPAGWMMCQGQLLAISEYETLFQLLGTTYGGDGQTSFALPDLRGRAAVHQGFNSGGGFTMGQTGGAEEVTLLDSEIPSHTHSIGAVIADGNTPAPGRAVFAASSAGQYAPLASATGSMGNMVSAVGGSQPHANLQPFLVVNPIISLYGVFPSHS